MPVAADLAGEDVGERIGAAPPAAKRRAEFDPAAQEALLRASARLEG